MVFNVLNVALSTVSISQFALSAKTVISGWMVSSQPNKNRNMKNLNFASVYLVNTSLCHPADSIETCIELIDIHLSDKSLLNPVMITTADMDTDRSDDHGPPLNVNKIAVFEGVYLVNTLILSNLEEFITAQSSINCGTSINQMLDFDFANSINFLAIPVINEATCI